LSPVLALREETTMTHWGRLLLSLLLLTATFAGASSAQREWAGLLGLEHSFAQVAEQREREAQLDRRHMIIHRRMEAKMQIIRELFAGKLSLFQAAARFGYLNDTPEDCRDPYRDVWAGDSDGEKLCRQVIGWAER